MPWMRLFQEWRIELQIQQARAAQEVKVTRQRKKELITACSGGSYHTQGFGCNKYARARIRPLETKLRALGLRVEVRAIPEGDSRGPGWSINYCRYELWANIPAWQGDAVQSTITAEDVVLACGRACHPQVLMPLSYDHPAVKNWPDNLAELSAKRRTA
jgi:hypothetical protein